MSSVQLLCRKLGTILKALIHRHRISRNHGVRKNVQVGRIHSCSPQAVIPSRKLKEKISSTLGSTSRFSIYSSFFLDLSVLDSVEKSKLDNEVPDHDTLDRRGSKSLSRQSHLASFQRLESQSSWQTNTRSHIAKAIDFLSSKKPSHPTTITSTADKSLLCAEP